MDVALLLEIDITGVTTIIHIISESNQSGTLDDERLTLDTSTLGEYLLIVFPRTIEIFDSATYRVFIIGCFTVTITVFIGVPFRQILILFGCLQLIRCRNSDRDRTRIGSGQVSSLARLLESVTELV